MIRQSTAEVLTPERCFIQEMHNAPQDPAVSVSRARVERGVTTEWHSLTGTDERYVIVSGEGVVEIGDEAPVRVTPGDNVLIPGGCRQRITNAGSSDLVFLCVCTPRFEPGCYVVEGE